MATIKDVAAEAGLTVTTVSRVLNNRGYISDDARRRVYDAMKKLNYRPNEVARSLHRKTTNAIGLIVPHVRHPYFTEMISNIENEAFKKGYRLFLCNTKGKEENEKEYLDICTGNRVAGIILFSGSMSVDEFVQLNVPVITMERTLGNGTASVECDNRGGGELAAKCLIDAGCRRILMVGSTAGCLELPADNRAVGFREVCAERGVSCYEIDPGQQEYDNLAYAELLERTLRENPETDGVFASSDVIGAQTLQVCRSLDIKVPEQMKIVGFDDSYVASLTTPKLTTIHQPVKEMAAQAVQLLQDAAEGRTVAKRVVLPVHLVERGTV